MAPRSLSEMVHRKMAKNIKDLVHIGNLTYAQVSHLLAKIESPAQLRRLEEWSPQLLGDDAELWQKFIARDFSALARKKNWAPKNPLSWSKVYDKYKHEHEMELKEAEEKMSKGFAELEAKSQSRTSQIVDRHLLPNKGGERRRPRERDSSPLKLGPAPKSGFQKFLKKTRDQAREVVHRRSEAALNGGKLTVRPGQIKKAPEMMVKDLRIKARPDLRTMPSRVSSAKPGKTLQEQKDKEVRLLAAKQKLVKQGATFISDSEESGGEGDDLFGDRHSTKTEQTDSREARLLAAKRKRAEPAVTLVPDSEDDELFDDEPATKKIKPGATQSRAMATLSPVPQRTATSPPAGPRAPGLLSAAYRGSTANPSVRRMAVPKLALSASAAVKEKPAISEKTITASSTQKTDLKSQPRSVVGDQKTPMKTVSDSARVSSTKAQEVQPASWSPPLRPDPGAPAARSSPPANSPGTPLRTMKRKRPVDVFMPLSKIAKR
jgi:elongin-A